MLGSIRPHKDYITFVLTELKTLAVSRPEQIEEYKDAILKMLIPDLDPVIPIITPLYPPIGRPAEMQLEILRSFILMKHMGVFLDNWVDKLSLNPVLRTIAGFTLDNMPKTSSYYDFINRIMPLDEHPVLRTFKSKPAKKLKKGEKLPPKNKHVVAKLANQLITDEKRFMKRLSRRPERFLQRIFARVSVDASLKAKIVPESVAVSGDGTCIETGASHYGKKDGHKMICYGFCKNRSRIKWRCPRSFTRDGLLTIPPCDGCSKSPYGRVVYTKPDWDLRLFTRIHRGSNEWISLMKERTAAERINNRILNDYRIEGAPTRGKKRISFNLISAAINVHLYAQIKLMKLRNPFLLDELVFLDVPA